jgi:hypothetical protein
LDDIATSLNVKELNDWYNVRLKDVLDKGGKGLLAKYQMSLYKALSNIYPDHKWEQFHFHYVPRGYWMDVKNQKAFLERVAKAMNITEYPVQFYWEISNRICCVTYINFDIKSFCLLISQKGWYSVQHNDILKFKGGHAILKHYGSVKSLLKAVYPEHSWDVTAFDYVTKGYWTSAQNRKEFLDALKIKLNISSESDWQLLTSKALQIHGGRGMLGKATNITKLLNEIAPTAQLERSKSFGKYKSQTQLYRTIRSVFPNTLVTLLHS